jgi:biopolymer transport protein ExbD
MLANKTPGRAHRIAGAGFIAAALLGAACAAWAQKPSAPTFAGATVTLDKDGHVLWSGKPAEGKALADQAKAQVASGVPHIRVSADASTQYINVQPVLEAAQKAGMQDIVFQSSGVVFVTPTPAPRPPPPPNQPKPVRVFIDFDGGIFWNGVWLGYDLPGFERNLADQVGLSPSPPEIHIEPNKQAAYVGSNRCWRRSRRRD